MFGLVMTPLDISWSTVSHNTLDATKTFFHDKVNLVLWETVVVPVLNLSDFAIFAALAFLFGAVGHRRCDAAFGRFTS